MEAPKPHLGRRIVLKMDLQDFFPSITGARIQTVFRTMGYPESVADLLGGISATPCHAGSETKQRGMPTDSHCRRRASSTDDLAFSGGVEFDLLEEGFSVNHRKTRIMRQGVRQRLADWSQMNARTSSESISTG